jgi:UDP-3-O-acyl-N-acetylglucosamine deacetylase
MKILKIGANNLYAQSGSGSMHVLEHLMPLRWMGFDQICVSGSSWPPMYSTKEYWNRIRFISVKNKNDYIESFSITNQAMFTNKNKDRMTSISFKKLEFAGDFESVSVLVEIDYPNIGFHKENYTLEDFWGIFGVYPQGYPLYRYYGCKFLKLFGWPHFDKVVWPQNYTKEKTLELFSKHRALDIFGALALIDHKRLPSNIQVKSFCSGHKYDLEAIKQLHYEYSDVLVQRLNNS